MRYIAFLRAINVGGRNVSMAKLRALFEGFGFDAVETFIASGNVIFTAPAKNAAGLTRKIETGLEQALGYEVRTFLRSEAALAAVVNYQPFAAARIRSAQAFNVAFLTAPPTAAQAQAVLALRSTIDEFHINGREFYWLCEKRQSESKFSNAVLERTLKAGSTLRSMSTIKKLAAKLGVDGTSAV